MDSKKDANLPSPLKSRVIPWNYQKIRPMTSGIQAVHLSLQCLMKITQHSRDFAPEFVTGQLLGMETDVCLEVSDSFPFASNLTDELEQEEYQIEMMKALRESNTDTNTVGWYQTCSFDAFVSSNLTEAQLVYQSTIPNSIVLIVDTSKASMSIPIVRAFQIRQNYRENLMEQSASGTDKFNLIFNEITVKIQTSILDKLFLAQESGNPDFQAFSPLSSPMDVSEYVVNFLSSLLECTDDSIAEVGKLSYSLRNIAKNSQAASRGKKKEDMSNSINEYLSALKANNSGNISSLCHNLCQIEQFEKLLGEICQVSEEKLNYN